MCCVRPADGHTRTFFRVVKMNPRPGSGKQGVGDEDAEAEAALVTPRREKRLAQPVEHFGGEAGAVVLDYQGQSGTCRLQRDQHLAAGDTGSRCRSGSPASGAARASASPPARPRRRTARDRSAPSIPGPRELACDMLEHARERGAGEVAMARRRRRACPDPASSSRQRCAWASRSPASSASGLPSGSSRTSSLAITLMVAKGVPRRWATAAACPPSAESCCSRASASWVAVSASERCRASSATLQANTAISMMARLKRGPAADAIERRQGQPAVAPGQRPGRPGPGRRRRPAPEP